ncbi:type II toxin-antitoxin system VapB family antitoxin [Oryzibacter oryziterrae]|uniref:type II toxin-antitoxin system VapB family antitoxin n=1 Tax=Oryzibacter oryziterrae TaxID=2766474 RepID=UPI001F1F29E6|nr:type II toxin-antitoxin system VapB family antitoxin [Oryzibacter oryziterrae]
MTINVTNAEADDLTRTFARLEGVSISEAIIIAMREAIDRRTLAETPLATAARLRDTFGIALSENARTPLPRSVFDAMWDA